MRNFIPILLITIIAIIFSGNLPAAPKSAVKGEIYDESSGGKLAGVTIKLEGTGLGCISKKDGSFIIQSVPSAKYSLLVSLLGYEIFKANISVKEGATSYLKIALKVQPLRSSGVIVSASKRLQAVQEVPISVSIIDLRGLEQRNITELNEALVYVPGVSMNGDHVSIRGSSGFAFGVGSRVSLLVDGFPLLSGDQGDMKFDAIPIFDIERVEIVKGAGSALYGTGALGGVINIITKEPQPEPDFRVRAYSGIYTKSRYQQWVYQDNLSLYNGFDAGFSQDFGNFGLILSGGAKKDDSYRKFDDFLKWNVFSKMKYDFSAQTSLSLLGSYAASDHADWVYWNSLDSATIPPAGTDLDNRIYSSKLSVAGEFKQILSKGGFLVLKSGIFQTSFHNNLSKSNSDYRESVAYSLNNELQLNNRLDDELFLTSGLNYTLNGVDASIYGNKSQNIYALYIQGESHHLKNITVTFGGRYDYEKTNNEKKNEEISPKLGISFATPFHANFRLSAGRGFRAPTVAERFASINYSGISVQPNPNLIPERSWSFEAGGSYEFVFAGAPLMLDFSLFQNELYNLIEPQFDTSQQGAVIKFMNVTRARVQGAELDIKSLLFGFIGFETSLTAMYPRDLKLYETLKYRSSILWYNRLAIPYEMFEFQLDYRFMSRIEKIDTQLKFQIKDYDARVPVHVVDARLLLNMKKIIGIPLKLSLNVKNLFDYYYIEMVGNLAPIRNISLQAEARF